MAKRRTTFYSQALTAGETRAFFQAPRDLDVDEEIALLRTRIRSLATLTGPEQELGVPEQGVLLRALDLLARLLRLKAKLRADEDDQLDALDNDILGVLDGEP